MVKLCTVYFLSVSLNCPAPLPINLTVSFTDKPATLPVIVVDVPTETAAVHVLAVCHVLPDGKVNDTLVVLLADKGTALLFTQLFVRFSTYM